MALDYTITHILNSIIISTVAGTAMTNMKTWLTDGSIHANAELSKVKHIMNCLKRFLQRNHVCTLGGVYNHGSKICIL